MEFIDHTGHIFSQQSYNSYPVGYELETLPYIFWLNHQYTYNLSIDNYYMLPIRPLISKTDITDIKYIKSLSVKCESSIFKLIPSTLIQKKIIESQSLEIELKENSDDFKDELKFDSTVFIEDNKLKFDDILFIEDDDYIMLPFYIIGNSSSEGTFTTTILINITYINNDKEKSIYCPITIGGVWVDEIEQLQINAANMGVNLPKDIIRAVYQGSLVNDKLDKALYNDKVKEYLINYMTLKGECGNTNSVINSLKWFGYGDKISLDKLIRTDNEIYNQYIHNNLSLNNDIIESFEHFVNTSLFTLVIKENEEVDVESFKFDKDFYGENNPQLKSLFDKLVEVNYGDDTNISFYKPYYDFTFQEMILKLSCLKYYYQKYFLPMHVGIYSASIQHKEYCNDIKFTLQPFNKIVCSPTVINNDSVDVSFPKDNKIFIYNQKHYVDDLYNEFTDYEELGNTTDMSIYYIDDLCFNIPIKISNNKMNYYKCNLLIQRSDNKLIYESSFSFYKSDSHDYNSLVILPKLINKKADINYWTNYNYTLYLCVNDKWFDYNFTLNIPELNISFGTLQYQYNKSLHSQLQTSDTISEVLNYINSISGGNLTINDLIKSESSDKLNVNFNAFMYLPSLVNVNNINFPKNVIDYGVKDEIEDQEIQDEIKNKNLLNFISKYKEYPMISNNKKYYNRVHYFTLYNANDIPVKYENNNEKINELYSYFFDNNGHPKPIIDNNNLNDKIHYDFYLMHDSEDKEDYRGILSDKELENWEPCWYGVFISKETIDNAITDFDLDIKKEYSDLDIKKEFRNNQYKLKYVSSDNKFLINRMIFKDSNGINIFNTDDIIVSTVNNVDLPFVLELGSHWNFKPYSLGMRKEANVYSNTNSAIISLGNDNNYYEPGYYDVSVRYSLDSNTQEQITKKARILVKS